MKTNFAQATRLINQMGLNYRDETIPVQDMWFDSMASLKINNQTVEVLPSAQRLFANRLGVPYSYLGRCCFNLQAQNLNYWLTQERQARETFFCRFDGNKLRAIFTDRYKALDNQEIIEKLSQYGFAPETEVHLNLSQNLMVMKIPDYSRAFDLGKDKMTPGIAISNSEVGLMAFSIEAYFYRLVCTNGLISKTEVTSKFRHVSHKALGEFNEIVKQVIEESQSNQDKLIISKEKTVQDPPATIDSFNRQFQLTKREAEAVKGAWTIEPGRTMFDVINAYTQAAQNTKLNEEEINKLERVGGQILALTK
jgi:hypothetical protein